MQDVRLTTPVRHHKEREEFAPTGSEWVSLDGRDSFDGGCAAVPLPLPFPTEGEDSLSLMAPALRG